MTGGSEPRRVLHVLEAVEGGTARHVVDLVRHVPGVEHSVAIPVERVGWATDRGARRAIQEAGGHVVPMAMRRMPHHPRNVVALRDLGTLLRTLQPSVVHGHSSVGGALARLACWRDDRPVLYTPNGLATVPVAIAIERRLAHRTTRLVAVSPSEAALAGSLGLASPPRLVMIPNGIDLTPVDEGPAAALRQRLGVPTDATVLGTISRLVPQKAPETFIRAARLVATRHPDLHVILVGSGPQRAEVLAEAASMGDRFHLVDGVDDGAAAVAAFDVFALASRFEGAPYTPLEAMRAGVPVVLTAVVGSCDVIEDGVTGRLVPVDRPVALADAICDVLAGEGPNLVHRAREQLHRFDVRSMGAAVGALYEELSASSASLRA